MIKKYEIHSGRRVVSTQYSVSTSQALVDYVRSLGVKDDEIRRLGVDSVSWRGAHFRALLVPAESQQHLHRPEGPLVVPPHEGVRNCPERRSPSYPEPPSSSRQSGRFQRPLFPY